MASPLKDLNVGTPISKELLELFAFKNLSNLVGALPIENGGTSEFNSQDAIKTLTINNNIYPKKVNFKYSSDPTVEGPDVTSTIEEVEPGKLNINGLVIKDSTLSSGNSSTNISFPLKVVSISSNITINTSYWNTILNVKAACTITIPSISTNGFYFYIKNSSTSDVRVIPSSCSIEGVSNTFLLGPKVTLKLISDGVNYISTDTIFRFRNEF